MRLDLAERLRCPRAHAPTPLIVVAIAVEERELRRGIAGCPVCRLEARIEEQEVRFDEAAKVPAPLAAPAPERSEDPSGPEFGRLRALLGLAEPGGAVLLTGPYARFADMLADAVDTAVVLMHAAPAPGVRAVRVRDAGAQVPFTDATFRAVALAAGLPGEFTADAARSVSSGGRVLGAASLAPPPGVRELARDASEWVAEREAAPAIVPLGRGR
jgi:hypothetical protein